MINCCLDPIRHRNGSNVAALAVQVGEHPMPLAKLKIFDFQCCCFRPTQTTACQHCEHCIIPTLSQSRVASTRQQTPALFSREPVTDLNSEAADSFDTPDSSRQVGAQ